MISSEQELAQALAVSVAQLRFTLCLFASIPVCWLQAQIRSALIGHLYALIAGFLLVYIPFGNGNFLALPAIAITYLTMLLFPRHCGKLIWMTYFPALIYIHWSNASGAAWKEGGMDATGALMILFLKMAAIAQCRQDGETLKGNLTSATDYQREKMLLQCPSLIEFFGYTFCFGHLLSGPFTEFKDYKDYIERKGIWNKTLPSRILPFLKALLVGVGSLALFVTFGSYYPVDFYFSDAYESATLSQKYLMMSVISFSHRIKFYFCWKIAEASSIAAGYAYTETKNEKGEIKIQWNRCQNADILQTEFASSFAKIPANWNICTGIFLRRYVYERLTPKNGKPTFITLLVTQVVSGLWHGLYPGYFLFFVTAAIAISVSRSMYKWEKTNSLSKSTAYRATKFLFQTTTLNYAGSAFMLLTFKESIQVFASLFFIPHIILIGLFLMGPFLFKSKSKESSKEKGT